MDLDRHIPGDSPVHRFDARLKLLLAVAAIVAVASLPMGAFAALALMLVLLVASSWWAGLGPTRLIRHAWIVLPFALVALPLVFTRPGEAVFSLEVGPMTATATAEGMSDALTIAAKSWISVQVALLLTFTTPFSTLLEALRSLRLPAVLVAVIGSMYRFLAVIGDEAGRMRRARAARSARQRDGAGGTLRWRARVTGSLVGSLFIRAYERSERVHLAMLSRGHDGRTIDAVRPRPDGRSLLTFGLVLAGIAIYATTAALVSV